MIVFVGISDKVMSRFCVKCLLSQINVRKD